MAFAEYIINLNHPRVKVRGPPRRKSLFRPFATFFNSFNWKKIENNVLGTVRKTIGALFHGLHNALQKNSTENAAPEKQSPEKRPFSGKNSKRKKQDRRTEDAGAYIRMADRRPASGSGGKKRKRSAEKAPDVKSSVRKNRAGVETKVIQPLPKVIPQPEEPGKLRFTDLELSVEVLAATQDLGFRYCTEIQAKCLPLALAGKDVAAKAQTGTGKTAAFLASSMTRLLRTPRASSNPGACRVLVLAPTRELAIQIGKDADAFAKYTPLVNRVVFGGMDHQEQRESLNTQIDILAGTPGRIIDFSRSGHLDLSHVEILVIDEADRMLDMGFIPDVSRIVGKLPPPEKRQTMLFSATLEPSVLRLAERWMRDPEAVASEPEHVVTDLIDQRFYAVTSDQKLAMLLSLIRTENPERMLVFGNRKDHNRTLAAKLYAYGVDAELLSGDVAQEKRLKILEKFRSGKTRVLVATDVAARGIHVEGISHVVNYDLPEQPDDYVHRIGRTGRAGAKGISISFVCEYGAYMLPDLEQYTKETIRTIQPEEEMLVLPEKIRREPVLPGSHSSGYSKGLPSSARRSSRRSSGFSGAARRFPGR